MNFIAYKRLHDFVIKALDNTVASLRFDFTYEPSIATSPEKLLRIIEKYPSDILNKSDYYFLTKASKKTIMRIFNTYDAIIVAPVNTKALLDIEECNQQHGLLFIGIDIKISKSLKHLSNPLSSFINHVNANKIKITQKYIEINGIDTPSYHSIRLIMDKHNLSPKDLGELLGASMDDVFKWISPPDSGDYEVMPIALWELLLLKLDEHPKLTLMPKSRDSLTFDL